MIKISSLILLLSVGLCAASIALRNPNHWNVFNNRELSGQFLGQFDFGLTQPQEDQYLTAMAQSVADSEGNRNVAAQNYPRQNSDNTLVFGTILKGDTTWQQLLTEDVNVCLDGMSSFLNFRYKNNTLNVQVNDLREFLDVAGYDSINVPIKANTKATENLWRTATGEFKLANDVYNYEVRFNNMLKVMQSMADNRTDRYTLDIFKNTVHTESYKNADYEMKFNVPDFFGPGFWSNQNGIWGVQVKDLLTRGGNIRTLSEIKHQYLKMNLEINEQSITSFNSKDFKEFYGAQFSSAIEMFDTKQIFSEFSKYGVGISLDSNGNIVIVFALSSPVTTKPVQKLINSMNIYNKLTVWPFLTTKGSTFVNPFRNLSEAWRRMLGLTIEIVNEDRVVDGLPVLRETDPSLTVLAQAAAERIASSGRFVAPDFSSRRSDTLVVTMTLSGRTKMNEYAFLINNNDFSQITCFDNFSNQKHKIARLIDNERYICSKNSKIKSVFDNWKRYTTYGTGYALSANGDAIMTIALSF